MKKNPDSNSHNLARQALSKMSELSIDPTPVNYAVWYHYVLGDFAELNKEIDMMLKKKTIPSEDVTIYLHNKYVAPPAKPVAHAEEKAAHDTQSVLAEIMGAIDKFSGDTESYNQQLDTHVEELTKKISHPMLKEMAGEIVSRATAMRESGRGLSKKLEDSRREVTQLKVTLDKVTNESTRDFLTGVANRRALEERIDEMSDTVKKKTGDLCLLMVDVDHFKQFNDRFGHQIGDEVLKKVSKTLTDSVKGKDFVARYGGEEFAVLLPDTPLSTALIVAENIRKNVADTELIRKDNGKSVGVINVSIGVSRFRVEADSVPLFISRADAALYRSKMGGRNRVTPESFD